MNICGLGTGYTPNLQEDVPEEPSLITSIKCVVVSAT